MRPTHKLAVGITLLTVEPVTSTGATGRARWDWFVTQETFNAEGERAGKVTTPALRTRAECLGIIRQKIEECVNGAIELVVRFTDTTGDFEEKRYHVDGTAAVNRERRAGIPAARCTPLPVTKTENAARRAVAKAVKPPGQSPQRGGGNRVVIPPAPVPGVERPTKPPKPPKPPATPAALPANVVNFLDALGRSRQDALRFLVENPRARGPIALWAGSTRGQSHPSAGVARALLDEVKAMSQKPVPTNAPEHVPDSFIHNTPNVVFGVDPVINALLGLSVAELTQHIRGLDGRDRQILAGKARARNVPPDFFARWEQANSVNSSAGIPDVVKRFMAEARRTGDDPTAMKRWLQDLPIPERRGIGGAVKHAAVPESVRALYDAARATPVVIPAGAITTPKPPSTPAPKPPSKTEQQVDAYRYAVQQGSGATYLAGFTNRERSVIRKAIERTGDSVLAAAFEQDSPQPTPAPAQEPAPAEEVRPTPVPAFVTAPPVVAPTPPAAGPSLADLLGGLTAGLAQLGELGKQQFGGAGSAESLRTRRRYS